MVSYNKKLINSFYREVELLSRESEINNNKRSR